ncbi:MAG: dTMP kinase [Pseudomonadota bacterium]
MFISLEGIDGAGKSTQGALLAAHLRESGREVVETREPGGTPGAELIRDLLVREAGAGWSTETEILLFTAARRDHVEKVIRPALARGAWVISDRFIDSTRAYQRANREMVDLLHRQMIGIEPDLTLIFDLSPEVSGARMRARAGGQDRFESRGSRFQLQVREALCEIAAAEPARCRIIDATGAAEEVFASTIAALEGAHV